jgi:hypothetical protein
MRPEQDEEMDMTSEAALISALMPKRVGELELEPFSLMRQVIAIDLCRRSSSVFFNAIMTVWVCTLKPSEALAVHGDIPTAQLRAFEWAEARGYSLTNYEPILELYERLNRELSASTQVQVRSSSSDGEAPKNVGGPAVP